MAKKTVNPEDSSKRHSAEKFEIIEIKRHQIKNAPYNPRTIKAENKKKLILMKSAYLRQLSGMKQPAMWYRDISGLKFSMN